MTIGLTHKAIGHLTAAIAISDTQITLNQNEYGQSLSAPNDVYLMIRGPVYR